MFYLFAIAFGFFYGGEVPQVPKLIGHFFGLRAVTTLIGIVQFGGTTGGAISTWLAGRIFDITHSYQEALSVAMIACLFAAVMALILKKQSNVSV